MISQFMCDDHRRCDEYFARAEEAAAAGALDLARAAFEQLASAMQRHFSMEEDILFPRFEALSGATSGPTAVMREEHRQMRALLDEMASALEAQDTEAFVDVCETWLVMMQQHNLKEEEMLYPMADQVLADERDAVLARLEAFEATA